MSSIALDIQKNIAILTISRPKQYNALNMETMYELEAALDRMAGDEHLRCLIITGAGEKAFVAGADTRELEALDVEGAMALSRDGNRIFSKVERFPVPVIAAINGFALGGGCELALACDIRIASQTASIGLPECSLGVFPGWGGTQRLARLIGYGRAAEIVFTAGRITAKRALEMGLVHFVAEPGRLMEEAVSLAEKIASNAPLALRAVKRVMREGLEGSLSQGLALESKAFAGLFATRDAKAGLHAVNNREKAEFMGE